jgi:molybdate transport system ATP-binding protein
MNNVTVAWSDHVVLDRLSWTLHAGEHWLIRGPNGSGKTTLLELITGDNPQVFNNDVRLFGLRRGSGETIWELKEKMGIVTYRLHTEYRSLGDLPLTTVLVSGLHDSIGMYEQSGEEELSLAEKWLALVGFAGRGKVLFRDLSYGEQRAILIARGAIKQPPILILDEPCHGLDPFHRERILSLLQKIAEHGDSTILHVTHDETEVLPCEKHILELRPGQNPMYALLER